jgi:hypothetical protein
LGTGTSFEKVFDMSETGFRAFFVGLLSTVMAVAVTSMATSTFPASVAQAAQPAHSHLVA